MPELCGNRHNPSACGELSLNPNNQAPLPACSDQKKKTQEQGFAVKGGIRGELGACGTRLPSGLAVTAYMGTWGRIEGRVGQGFRSSREPMGQHRGEAIVPSGLETQLRARRRGHAPRAGPGATRSAAGRAPAPGARLLPLCVGDGPGGSPRAGREVRWQRRRNGDFRTCGLSQAGARSSLGLGARVCGTCPASDSGPCLVPSRRVGFLGVSFSEGGG